MGMNENSKLRGRSSSTHELAEKVKAVRSASSDEGVTAKVPGSGGPLVTNVMEDDALKPDERAQVTVKVSDCLMGRALAANTKY